MVPTEHSCIHYGEWLPCNILMKCICEVYVFSQIAMQCMKGSVQSTGDVIQKKTGFPEATSESKLDVLPLS
jgi:hypothetical protein